MSTPRVGDDVQYFALEDDGETYAPFVPGIICRIWEDGTTNIAYFDKDGTPFATKVVPVTDGTPPTPAHKYCVLMRDLQD